MTNRKFAVPVKKRRAIRLSNEAFKTVEEKANEITEALMEATRQGKVMSTRFLVELAERDEEVEEVMIAGPLRSLALKLAQAVQSRPRAPRAAAETGTEIRQPVED